MPRSGKTVKILILSAVFLIVLAMQACSTDMVSYITDNQTPKAGSNPESSSMVRILIAKGASFTVTSESALYVDSVDSGGSVLKLDETYVGKKVLSLTRILFDGKSAGNLVTVAREGSALCLVSLLPLNNYLAGVLKGEMGLSFPGEALKAQAVAARTYYLAKRAENGNKPYDITGTVEHQVVAFEDIDKLIPYVDATAGECLTYNGAIITAFFHASSGGMLTTPSLVWGDAGQYPYYSVYSDPWSDKKVKWQVQIGRFFMKTLFVRAGLTVAADAFATAVAVTSYGPDLRAKTISVTFSDGSRHAVGGEQLRKIVGWGVIKSTLFTVSYREQSQEFVFEGIGAGHGVGMSQWGARTMADAGKTYREILAFYYTGCALQQIFPK